jgi:hypothetical protein
MSIDTFPERWQKGKSYRKYCYTLEDIARLKGVSIYAIRKAIQRGKLDPGDLLSLSKYLISS